MIERSAPQAIDERMSQTKRRTRAARRRALLPLLYIYGLLGALSVSLACGGGGPSPAVTPEPSATVRTEPSPSVAVTPSPPPEGEPSSIDLAATAAMATVYGTDSGDLLSDIPAVATGDLNDDGFDDILVGARFADGPDNSRDGAGEAYVIFGSQPLREDIDTAAGEQDLTVYGESEGSNFGFAVAAGDVNGDGVDDMLVGAPTMAARGRTGGAVYVVFGSEDLGGTVDTADGQQDLTIDGPGGTSLFGDSLAISDVNGDGSNDIVIGSTFAPDQEKGTGNVGAVYVIFGPVGAEASIDTALNEQDVVIFGAEPSDELGDSVATGDVNGDGIDDIIATAEAADGPDNDRPVAAEVHVVFGSTDLSGTLRIGDGDQDVSVYGAEAQDTLGFSLTSGDLDGDGIDDIIMGARLADGPKNDRQQAGEVYVVFGATGLAGSIDIAQDQQDLTIFGADASDFFGSSVAVADVDGDGSKEAILGAGFAAGPGNRRLASGEAYVLGPVAAGDPLDIAKGAPRITIFGAEAGDGLALSLASGDLNGDGREEVLLTAAHAPGFDGTPEAGRIYVVSIDLTS